MTMSVIHTIGPNGGHTLPKGTRPSKPVNWAVSLWFLMPDGEKTIRSMTVPNAMMFDLVPLVNEQVDAMIAEMGNEIRGAGWTAHGRGQKKRKR
jgi:hypothetical protein